MTERDIHGRGVRAERLLRQLRDGGWHVELDGGAVVVRGPQRRIDSYTLRLVLDCTELHPEVLALLQAEARRRLH